MSDDEDGPFFIPVGGMDVPIVHRANQNWLWFTDPRRTALHWAMTFREVIEQHGTFSNQGFSVDHEVDASELVNDEPIIVPRAFLLELFAVADEHEVHFRGGGFGRR